MNKLIKEALILEDSSSSVEFVESGDVNGSKQEKIKDKCDDFEKEVIILGDSSSSVEIIQDSNDNLALLTIETTQNSSEGLGLSKEDLNRINEAYYEQIIKNKEDRLSKVHMINTPIESYHDQFLQTNSKICNLEKINNLQDQTILTKKLDSRDVQEPIEDFLNNLLMQGSATRRPRAHLRPFSNFGAPAWHFAIKKKLKKPRKKKFSVKFFIN